MEQSREVVLLSLSLEILNVFIRRDTMDRYRKKGNVGFWSKGQDCYVCMIIACHD